MAQVQTPLAYRHGGRSDGAYCCHDRFAAALGAGATGRTNPTSIRPARQAQGLPARGQAVAQSLEARHLGPSRAQPLLDHVQVRALHAVPKDGGQAGHQAAAPLWVMPPSQIGRAILSGHFAVSGQLAASQRTAFSNRLTWMSRPSMIAPSFLLSPNSRQLTVVVSAPVARPYSAASSRS